MSALKIVVFLLSFRNFAIIEAQAASEYLYHRCSANKNFTANSAYQFNLNTLLSSLSSATTEFCNTTAGSTDDTVYGQFMCRGDVPPEICRECVQNATQRISSECRYSKEAIIWYAECLLRYSNLSFFSTVNELPSIFLLNTGNISSQESSNEVLAKTLAEVVAEASNPSGSQGTKNFATKSADLSSFQTLYTLVQCTPDLSSQDCNMCLRDAMADIPLCCLGRLGGRVLFPSCNLRFEAYPFYRTTARALVPTPSTNPPTVSTGHVYQGKGRSKSRTIIMVVVPIVVSMILFGFCCYFLQKRRKKSYKAILLENCEMAFTFSKLTVGTHIYVGVVGDESATLESLQFNLGTIEAATNKFSQENRVGKGGFGEVYKGILLDGRDIAVKRLSRSSEQGAVEFKNEVLLIAKLQHRNLVALLGFCLEEQEKILIYEYVPNKSLDHFLFDPQKRRLLNWSERYKIIGGIVRGVLYLHEYSRLKIIHHDLKPSNILLDDNMNPKISDFGMARIVAITETEGSTNRIVGTYGYMSPEYVMLGQFSEKSDVFSFGVMILEIISGKRNTNSYKSQLVDGLLSYAWKLWRDETPLEILDPNLEESHSRSEVTRCIQIGLLCVQENPEARPSMAAVLSYLGNHSIEMPFPQEPAFFMHGRIELNMGAMESSSGQSNHNSIPTSLNEMSMTAFFPR